jgi:hypothetical protein
VNVYDLRGLLWESSLVFGVGAGAHGWLVLSQGLSGGCSQTAGAWLGWRLSFLDRRLTQVARWLERSLVTTGMVQRAASVAGFLQSQGPNWLWASQCPVGSQAGCVWSGSDQV